MAKLSGAMILLALLVAGVAAKQAVLKKDVSKVPVESEAVKNITKIHDEDNDESMSDPGMQEMSDEDTAAVSDEALKERALIRQVTASRFIGGGLGGFGYGGYGGYGLGGLGGFGGYGLGGYGGYGLGGYGGYGLGYGGYGLGYGGYGGYGLGGFGLFDEDQTDNSTLGASGNATLAGPEEGAKNKTFVLRLPKRLMKKLIRRFGVKDGEENHEEKYVTVLATAVHVSELGQQYGMGMWEGDRRRHHGRRRSHRNRVFLIAPSSSKQEGSKWINGNLFNESDGEEDQ